MHECHDATMSGHLGMAKTIERCTRSFYWPRMHDEVRTYVQSCMACQSNKPSNQHPAGLLQSLPIPDRRWQQITMDLITQLPKTERGYDAVVVFVDKLSKMIHIAPTHTTVSAPDLARIMMHEVVRLHGLPESIVSDRDVRFTSIFWRCLWSHFGTRLKMSTAYHPQTDGQTERANRTIEDMLRAYVSWEQDDWDQHLTAAEFAYNNSVQASTGCTPFYLNAGQHPLSPVDLVVRTRASALDTSGPSNPASDSFVQRIDASIERAKTNLQAAQARQAKYADQHRREETYKIGDRVLLSTAHLNNQERAPKLMHRYIGPFPICRVVSPVAYELTLPSTMSRVHHVFHVSQLRRYIDGVSLYPDREQTDVSAPPPTIIESGEEAWEVERIVKKRKKGRGVQYLIKWKGYPDHENTWEPASNVRHAQEAVQEFEQRTKRRTDAAPRIHA